MSDVALSQYAKLFVRQRREMAELIGFETRNKYEIMDERQLPVAFAAEQQKGFLGLLARQLLGHWRTFEIIFFDPAKQPFMIALHPFRFFFQRLEVRFVDGRAIGALQQRFALLHKRFDVEGPQGQILLEVKSPIWKIWTFDFQRAGQRMARVVKKWSGLFSEAFTDKDNFLVEFESADLSDEERHLLLAAAVFIDLQYFERKANNR